MISYRIRSWRTEINDHKLLIIISLVFLIIAIILNHAANTYVEKKTPMPATDLILDNIPSINLSFIFVFGFILIIAIPLLYTLFFKVKELHKVIGQFSLLVMIRSFFITLTHLGLPQDSINFNTSDLYSYFVFQNDMFFSGHVAISFLGFLIYRKEKIGKFFLVMTFVMMATVLFMHVHYSIDVFAALFITYGSFKIGEWLFKRFDRY